MSRFGLSLVLASLTAVVLPAAPAGAQDLHPSRRPSPIGIAKTFVGDTYVKVTYGRPYMRGRAIFGPAGEAEHLVPFGETWRTGANEATEITVTGPVMVMGRRLEAGTYSIFTVPGASAWEVRFHPGLGMDGIGRMSPEGGFTPTYDPALDVLVVEAPVGTLDEPVEQFTIRFEETTDGTAMVLRWETTEVRVPITAATGVTAGVGHARQVGLARITRRRPPHEAPAPRCGASSDHRPECRRPGTGSPARAPA